MATSSKFDLSSDSPDRPLYAGGQRGSHLATQLDRSGSFRESLENPILSSLPNMTRGSSVLAQGDVVNFFQCLRFDPKVVAADHKFSCQGDVKRHIYVAFGISGDDPPLGSLKGKVLSPPPTEEIKRVKASLRESYVKARERMKIFSEALSVFNKFFPSLPSKKRSRLEGFSNERSSGLLSSDRFVMGPGLGKMGIQNQVVTGGLDLEQQKLDERTKNSIPNKRTRTSLVDVRSNTIARQSAIIDRDREMLRIANSDAVQGDEQTLAIGVDGWEKTKMKKKRSGIKPDVSPSVVPAKSNNGHRELKQGMQQRPVADARAKLNSDTHGFRSNVRDHFNSASPTSSTKMNASIRAPRSGSGIATKLSPVVQRATAPNDWELSHCTNKPRAVGANNRKRTASTRSSSPPVARWAGQRPQKISRAARRTNLIPIVSNNDESSARDTVSDVSGNEIGLGFARRLTGNSTQQVGLKGDIFSSAALSESEESGATEIKSKDKGKKSKVLDKKAGQSVQKVSTVGLPSRKNKLVGEGTGDGVWRQGRTGRDVTSTRSLMPMTIEKLGNVGTAKQLRSARLGFDKNESKAGRPPTRKVSERKAYVRQKHTMVNSAADFLVGSDDGHDELLAAASAVVNSANALSNSFWRQMEPFFGIVSNLDIAYLKKQGNFEYAAPTSIPCLVNSSSTVPNGYGLIEHETEKGLSTETRISEILPEQLVPADRGISLSQRLIAAIISEEDCSGGNGDLEFDAYGTGFELDEELGSNGLNHLNNLQFSEHSAFNGYKVTGNQDHVVAETDILGIPNMGINPTFSHYINGLLSEQALVCGVACSEFEYNNMQINERLRLEVQSIGISPEPRVEDEGISGDISKLKEKCRGQISTKRGLLDKLLKSASELREFQEMEFERAAYDKLVTMAYEKYMSCCGPNASGGKSSSNKMAKQAALAFVKRTLERCHKFEDMGKGCFGEPLFKDIFISHLNGVQSMDTPMDCESAKLYANTSSRSLEARVSASTCSQPSPRNSHFGDGYIAISSDLIVSEQTCGKEDAWSNRVKKRELLLDDVVGTSSDAPSEIGSSLSSSTKGRRSERDREGKGHNREVISKNGTNKIGRSALSNIKGERKSKTKPKQKTTQLSVSVSGLLGGKMSDQHKPTLPSETKSSEITTSSGAKGKAGFGFDVLDDPEAIDLSNLQLPEMDDNGQGQDLDSWLDIEDDGLQGHDIVGLEIPMDDLRDLNMTL